MPLMSNSRASADAVAYRPAEPHELNDAIRLLLGGINGHTTESQILEFVSASQQRGLDVRETWVAVRGDQVVWSLLPVVSPGRTMLVLSPPHAPTPASGNTGVVGELMDRVCSDERQRHEIELAQMLVDPAEISLTQLYIRAGFIDLAELIYLHRSIKKMPNVSPLPAGYRFETYRESTHAAFLDTIARSYANSLDCPALNGLRGMEDVLVGHKHSGEFDPDLWYLLMEANESLGVMLLSRSSRGDAIELVYLGLVPEARGKQLASTFMQLALVTVVRQNKVQLTLAVDSRNTPAIKLYQRHGLSRLGSRRALIRDLRESDTGGSPVLY